MENHNLFPNQTAYYKGKVRDVYSIGNKHLLMIASERISAFDVILPRPIPFKGRVLNLIAAEMLEATKDICDNWLLATPTPETSFGLKCEPFKIEMVVRGHLTGHAWRQYQLPGRTICGITMPEGMKEHDRFPHPLITPTTKADQGHDEDISEEGLLKAGLASAEEWNELKAIALKLFERGREIAARRGLILCDTKYEFGKLDGRIVLMDEIHTPDSSRYFFAEGFDKRQEKGEKQEQLSKEFVREWLIENNFMGKEGQQVPVFTDEKVAEISNRYIKLYEILTGKELDKRLIGEDESKRLISECIDRYVN